LRSPTTTGRTPSTSIRTSPSSAFWTGWASSRCPPCHDAPAGGPFPYGTLRPGQPNFPLVADHVASAEPTRLLDHLLYGRGLPFPTPHRTGHGDRRPALVPGRRTEVPAGFARRPGGLPPGGVGPALCARPSRGSGRRRVQVAWVYAPVPSRSRRCTQAAHSLGGLGALLPT
jgi:hypothetical protein